MKTIHEHLTDLPEPDRSRAIMNLNPFMAHREARDLTGALMVAFYWSESPEGYEYWQGVMNRIRKQNHIFR